MGFMIVTMLLCGSLALPVRAIPTDWSKPRPSEYTVYDETIGNSKTDGVASIEFGVHIGQYSENDPAYNYNDHLSLKVSASANTRVGIQYDLYEDDYSYQWCVVSEPTGIAGDNSGAWLNLGFTFLYYGVEYREIWVCSNGFLTLNKTYTNAYPQSIPNTDEPNPVIAVFWRDLHPEQGGSITYGRDVYFNNGYYFVVSWNNVPDSSGNRQTFQVLIQNVIGGVSDSHNKIFFQYNNITKSYQTTVGTEDQVGNKGTAYDYNNLHNQACLRFDYPIAGYRLDRLKIKLTKSDSYAKIDFLRTCIGGYNVILEEYENPFGDTFEAAIEAAAGLALLKAGIVWNVILITAEFAWVLANDLSRPPTDEEHVKDAWENDPEAWAWGECVVENRSLLEPFDSTLATTVEWSFTDANEEDHDLTVTAEAWYRNLSNDDVYTISTSSTLNMYISNTRQLSLSSASGGTTDPAPGTYTYDYGESVIVTAIPDTSNGYTFDCWSLDGATVYGNPKTVTMNSDHTLKAYFKRKGGCPTLFVWNGTDYAEEGILNIHAESDVTVQHEIQNTLTLQKGVFKLQLRELDNFTSHIDQVKLYAVDSEGEWHSCPLTHAYHNELGKVTWKLFFDDEKRVDLTPTQTIDLKFLPSIPYGKTVGFIFEINGYNSKTPL